MSRKGLIMVLMTMAGMAHADDSPALKRLRGEADALLTAVPHSVMDKTRMPPSQDKHDYLSIGPYWWPDPAKSNGLPWISRDGLRNPESRRGTDREPLEEMTSRVETLALAYRLTGHAPYAAKAVDLLRVWFLDPETKMNPNLEFGQGVPGLCTGRGIGIIDTLSLVGAVRAMGWLDGAPAWTPEVQKGMKAWFRAYLNWMLTSKHGHDESRAANNHGTWYLAQTATYALFVGDTAQARKSVTLGRDRIASQIEPDGRMPLELKRTRSYGYTLLNLKGLLTLGEHGLTLGVDLFDYRTEDGRCLRTAIDYAAPYIAADRKWPGQQIQPVQQPDEQLASILRRAANAWHEPKYEQMIQMPEFAASRFQLIWPPAPPAAK